MISYSYKDVKMQINGQELYCSDMDVSYGVEITSAYNIKSIYSHEFNPSRSPAGNVSFNYYLTGVDPLVNNINNHTLPIQFFLGGYAFNSGYLTSYKLEASPNSYLKIGAGLSFFESIENDFEPSSSTLTETDFLKAGDIRLTNNAYLLEDEIMSLGYNYSIKIDPVYVTDPSPDHQDKTVHRISFGNKKVDSFATVTKQDLDLPVTGAAEQFKIKLNDKNGIEKQSYIVNGRLISKKTRVSVGQRMQNEVNIVQASLGTVDAEKMTIAKIWPVSGNRYYPPSTGEIYSASVGITGTNFVDIDSIYLGDFKMKISGNYSSTAVTGIVPRSVPSHYWAPIRVYGKGGFAVSDTGFLVVSGASL